MVLACASRRRRRSHLATDSLVCPAFRIYTASGAGKHGWKPSPPLPLKKVASSDLEFGSDPVSVLAVTNPADLQCLARILGHTRWSLRSASSLAEAMDRLQESSRVVVVSDTWLAGGTWKDLLAHALERPSPPPLIVAAHHADDRLWMEVLNSGGYNLIGKPFEEHEVFRVISMAWLHGRKRAHAAAPGR